MTYLTRASALFGFHEFATSQTLNPTALFQEAGLPSDVLEHPDSLIPYHRFALLLKLCAQASNNPTFGLQFGLYQGVGIFGSMLYLVRNAQNVGDALHDLGQYFHIHNNAAEVIVQLQEDHALLCYSSQVEDLPDNRQLSELAAGVGYQLMRTLLGSRWQPSAVLFQHAPLAPLSIYRRLLGMTPRFNSPFDAWMFNTRLLSVPLIDADQALHRLIQQHLDALNGMEGNELPDYVQRLLRNLLPCGRATVEYIANVIKLSPRSLQRHLAQAGTSFQQILDQTRQAMTVRYLKESDLTLIQIAGILGYSDQSAFTRAFQRWYGVSPREWIKQHNFRPQNRFLKR